MPELLNDLSSIEPRLWSFKKVKMWMAGSADKFT